jgi:NodT family efflux transporter outer membrane factor (OMF) lipoprotein
MRPALSPLRGCDLPAKAELSQKRLTEPYGSTIRCWSAYPLKLPFFVVAAALLSGCNLGPDFQDTAVWAPSSWFTRRPPQPTTPSRVSAEPIDARWWQVFGDPVLTRLEERVSRSNLDVRLATLRLQESRSQRGVTAADEYPNLNGNGSYTREKISDRGVIGLLGGGGNGGSVATSSNGLSGTEGGIPTSAASSSSGGPGVHLPAFNLFQSGFDSTWEIDFWGRVRRQVEAADAQIEANAEARRDSMVTVLAELARDYLVLRGQQRDLQIAQNELASEQGTLRLTEERQRGGLATGLDVANASAQVGTTAATLPQFEAQVQTSINAISLLLGETPGALRSELEPAQPVPPVPPEVPIGLPSELTQRRPDIRRAEAQLHAATADIGAAEADFFPRVTLSGSVGAQAVQFKDLGNLGAFGALQYSGGPSVTIPIFQGGRLRYTLELRKQQQQEAAVQFQQAVLQAFHDVDNALTNYSAEQLRRGQLARATDQARRALALARQQYVAGLSTFLDVLTAERTELQAEQAYADSTTTISTNLVQLYKALGGGWEADFPRGTAAERPPLLFVRP